MDVNTRRLRHFVTLAETLHFTRAAEILYVSQQGLSRSIAELEREVGAALVERSTRSVVLTEAGAEFLGAARRALAELDAGTEAVRRLHRELSGVLRLGFTVSSALELTPLIIDTFRTRYPAVNLELENYSWEDPSCGLRSGETDVAFVRLPVNVVGLSTEPLFVEPRAIGMANSHPLAASDMVRLKDLSDQVITVPRTNDARWKAFWTLRDTSLDEELLPRIGPATSSAEEELELVSAGLALAVTVISMARFSPRPTTVYRLIEDVPGSAVALAWREPGSPLTRAFRDVTAEVRDREADLVARIEAGL